VLAELNPTSILKSFKSVLVGQAFAFFTPARSGDYVGRILFLAPGNKLKGLAQMAWASYAQLLITLFFGSIGLFYNLPFLPWLKYAGPFIVAAALIIYFHPGQFTGWLKKLSLLQINSLRSLEIWSVWEKDPWIQKFERVKEYYESNRNPDLEPTDFSHNDWWLDNKKNFKNNKLKASRLKLLRTFSQWTEWETKNKTREKKTFTPWDESFRLLQTYFQEHRSFPSSHKPECITPYVRTINYSN
jgi:hypothetical protein